jgi:uncharacterized membrane protein YkvI
MVVMATPMVKMSKKAKITIMGAGFKPGQEIRLLFTDVGGVEADIGYALKEHGLQHGAVAAILAKS